MLFNSLEFLLFFPITTTLYFLCPHRFRWVLLLAASCFFYMMFVPVYILILAFTIVVDYFAGMWIENARGAHRKWLLGLSLVANIGVLAVFKYYGFLTGNIHAVFEFFGAHVHLPALGILLPIGLSFHTFQAMSYTIEVYLGNQPAERHFGIYSLYVMFYPQLVAGPIERPQNLLHQFREEHFFDPAAAARGLKLMAQGIFKKVVIADQLALAVNVVYDDPAKQSGIAALLSMLFFAFQIYFDFSGYSDIALGSAEVMGFKLMRNFDTPYFSASIGEFWRRWHISLSTWFRDYVYVPLGGSRVSKARRCVNVMIVFLISGLWHGASWTYVAWGAIHGGMIVLESIFGVTRSRNSGDALLQKERLWRTLGVARTFVLVCIAWVFFRAKSFSDAGIVLARAGAGILSLPHWWISGQMWNELSAGSTALNVALIAGAVFFEALDRRKNIWERLATKPVVARYIVYLAIVYVTLFIGVGRTETQFIYFQF